MCKTIISSSFRLTDLPYPSLPSPPRIAESDMHHVERAMKNISDQTCIKFRRTYDMNIKHCIIRRPKSGCSSSLGYPLKPYTHSHLNLSKGCLVKKGILHELLHALGFYHMHQVPDRDEYVEIVYENIKKNAWGNFAKIRVVKDLGVPYDIRSLMHYNPRDFSANGKRTIESRIKGIDAVGGAKGMSQLDVEKLNRLYCRLYDSF